MKKVKAFDKMLYVGKGFECARMIRRLEQSKTAYMLKCQRDKMNDNDVYGIYIDRSGFYASEPTIIILESRSVSDILVDWYGKEV